MDIHGLIEQIEDERAAAEARRDRANAEARTILDRAVAEGRARLTAAEDADVQAALERRDQAKTDIARAERALARAHAARDDELDAAAKFAQRTPNPATTGANKPAYDRVARVLREERTYHPGNCRNGREFVSDVVNRVLGDPMANDRVLRHMQEEVVERGDDPYLKRAIGTGAVSGLVVPQYLTDLYAPNVAALRPFANTMNRQPLPEAGMQFTISRITTSTQVGQQASENTAVTERNLDDTLLTVNVKTAAGQQTISRQAIERGTGVEDVTLLDLYRQYATNLDSTVLTEATTGLTNVAQTTAYTSASPTVAELWPYLFQAQSKLEQTLAGVATVDTVVMHTRRWNWMCAAVGSSWPLIGADNNVPTQASGVRITNEYGPSIRGVLSNGLRVCVDNSVPTTVNTNQDEIYVVASNEAWLWEDPNAPVLIRAEQPAAASLGVLLVVYGYYAYTFGRYANNPGKIGGTGLAAPAGF